MSNPHAFVTLATNDTYAIGALVLARSLQRVGSKADRAILITPDVSAKMRSLLAEDFNLVKEVDVINSHDEKILAVMKRPELGITLTKIHCWTLEQYSKAVFLDADTLVVKNVDELFDREELSAVPDIGWPDCFNSGVFVYRPSVETFTKLTEMAATEGSFDGGDQGLLNQYFSNWRSEDISKHLSFIYNMTLTSVYSYAPAYRRFGGNVKIIHFLGAIKPWLYGFDPKNRQVQHPPYSHTAPLDLVQNWWNVFIDDVQPRLAQERANFSGLASALAQLSFSEGSPTHTGAAPSASEGSVISPRLERWQQGHPDFMGTDAYELSVAKRLDEALGTDLESDQLDQIPTPLLHDEDNPASLTIPSSDDSAMHELTTTSSDYLDTALTPPPDDYDSDDVEEEDDEDDMSRLKRWEHGQIDYLGKDAFEVSVMKRLQEALQEPTANFYINYN